MTPATRIRPKIGDIVEIPTPLGLSYAQYTHKHRQFGALLRVLVEKFQDRPRTFSWVSEAESQFVTFFPLGAACHRGILTIVSNEHIGFAASKFPVFRSCIRTPSGRGPWWLWDGEREWKVGDLTPGMERLPIRGVINDTLLIERISSGWRHEHDA